MTMVETSIPPEDKVLCDENFIKIIESPSPWNVGGMCGGPRWALGVSTEGRWPVPVGRRPRLLAMGTDAGSCPWLPRGPLPPQA